MNWEHQIAVAFMTWWAYSCKRFGLDERLLHAIPNGGGRRKATAGMLKVEGVRAGVSDYFLAVPRGAHHGLYLELKSGGRGIPRGSVSKEQKEFGALAVAQGYFFRVVFGTDEAIAAIESYLGPPCIAPPTPSPAIH